MKKNNRAKSILFLFAFVILSLMLGACKPSSDSSSEKSPQSQTQSSETKQSEQTKQSEEPSKQAKEPQINAAGDIRADETKDWVYSMDMSDLKTYERGGTQIIYEINLPTVNIDSEDARYFNAQMERYAKQLRDVYHISKNGAGTSGQITRYAVSKKDDLLSIRLLFALSMKSEKNPEETVELNQGSTTFNISRKTGKIISNEEMLERFQIKDLDERVTDFFFKRYQRDENHEKALSNPTEILAYHQSLSNGRIRSIINHLRNRYDLPEHPLYVGFQEEADQTYWPNILFRNRKGPLQLFYHESKDSLCIMLPDYKEDPSIAAEMIEIVLNETSAKQSVLNPVYAHYSQKLGIDPLDEKAPTAFSAYLGNLRMTPLDGKVQGFLNETKLELFDLDYIEVNHFLSTPQKGDQMFLIIPKYDDTLVDLMQMESKGQKQVYEYIDYGTNRNFLLVCNHKDFDKDVELYFHHGSKMSDAYTPRIDPKDNSNLTQGEVQDISALITSTDRISEEVRTHFDQVRFGLDF